MSGVVCYECIKGSDTANVDPGHAEQFGMTEAKLASTWLLQHVFSVVCHECIHFFDMQRIHRVCQLQTG